MAFLLTPTSLRTVTSITVSLDTVLVYLTIHLHTPLHPFLSAPAHFLSCLLHTFSLNNHLSNLHIHNTTALHPYYSPTPIPTVLPLFPYHYYTNLPFSFPTNTSLYVWLYYLLKHNLLYIFTIHYTCSRSI